MMTSRLPLLALAAGLAAGCNAASRGPDAGEVGTSLVRVGLTFTRGGTAVAPGELRFAAQAHFVRLRGGDLPWVSAVLGLPDDAALPLDSCRVVDGASEIDRVLQDGDRGAVELLDAGRITARGPLGQVALQAWHYPQLTPYASGVVYGTDEAKSLQLEPGATYSVAGEGGEEIGPFGAQVPAPRAFALLEPFVYRAGGDLDLRWSASVAGGDAEAVILAVSFRDETGAREVRCRVRDDGAFRVARAVLPATRPRHAEVAVSRFRHAPLWAPGGGRGELVIELRDQRSLPALDSADSIR